MRTQIEVTGHDGSPLGILATVTELVPIMRENPNATYAVHVIIENPCDRHASFEADNCPSCGTSAVIS
jgi:hypothetical protein